MRNVYWAVYDQSLDELVTFNYDHLWAATQLAVSYGERVVGIIDNNRAIVNGQVV